MLVFDNFENTETQNVSQIYENQILSDEPEKYLLENCCKMQTKANKISLNSSKTELILFRAKHKNITKNMNFRISGKKINIICKTKYLGLILDKHLTFKYHLENLKLKQSRANCLLSKIRYFVKFPLLRTIYYALFDTHFRYGCQTWGQNQSKIVEAIIRTQNKALRILNFKGPQESVDYLYEESKIDKLKNIIIKDNCRLVYDQLKNNLPEIFRTFFTLNAQLHKHSTRKNRLILPRVKSITYGLNSTTLKAIKQ